MQINRHNSIATFFIFQGILLGISFYVYNDDNVPLWPIIMMLLVYAILIFLYYVISPLLRRFNRNYVVKKECPYLTTQECPFGDPKQCKYDKSACHYITDDGKHYSKNFWLGALALVTLLLSVLGGLVGDNELHLEQLFKDFNAITCVKILAPVSTSVLAAIIMAWILDIPARMVEYKNYFIRILSSYEYLKQMKEEDLAQLRSKITWLLHAKDVPNMPKRLIQMDEQICQMLRQPYYNEYMQNVKVSKHNKDGFFHKTVKIEFIAFNPYRGNRHIMMDIGMANSLKFDKAGDVNEAKELFKLTKFTICFDENNEGISLLPSLKMAVLKDDEPGLIYNGKIVPVSTNDYGSKENPFREEDLKKNQGTQVATKYENKKLNSYSLYVLVRDRIKVNIEYDVIVPSTDNTYTKRLRYPVKIFHLDYTLDDTIKDYTLVGQLIGTLIDQSNVSTELHDNNKRICLRTHEFLLPKNGAMIVHCSQNNNK